MADPIGVCEEACAYRLLMRHGRGALEQFTAMQEVVSWEDASVLATVRLLLSKGCYVVENRSGSNDTLAWARRRFAIASSPGAHGTSLKDTTAASQLLGLVLQHTSKLGLSGGGSGGGSHTRSSSPPPGAWGTNPVADVATVVNHVLRYPREEQRKIVAFHPHCATAVLAVAAGGGPQTRHVVHWVLAMGAAADGVDIRKITSRKAANSASPTARNDHAATATSPAASNDDDAPATATPPGSKLLFTENTEHDSTDKTGDQVMSILLPADGQAPQQQLQCDESKRGVQACGKDIVPHIDGDYPEIPRSAKLEPGMCMETTNGGSKGVAPTSNGVSAYSNGGQCATPHSNGSDAGTLQTPLLNGCKPHPAPVHAHANGHAAADDDEHAGGAACEVADVTVAGLNGTSGLQGAQLPCSKGSKSTQNGHHHSDEHPPQQQQQQQQPQACDEQPYQEFDKEQQQQPCTAANGHADVVADNHHDGPNLNVLGGRGERSPHDDAGGGEICVAADDTRAGVEAPAGEEASSSLQPQDKPSSLGLAANGQQGCVAPPNNNSDTDDPRALWVLSPLAQAAAAGDKYVVQLLLEVHGASPGAYGGLAERAAAQAGHHQLAKLIFERSMLRRTTVGPNSSAAGSTGGAGGGPGAQPQHDYQYVTLGDWVRSMIPSWRDVRHAVFGAPRQRKRRLPVNPQGAGGGGGASQPSTVAHRGGNRGASGGGGGGGLAIGKAPWKTYALGAAAAAGLVGFIYYWNRTPSVASESSDTATNTTTGALPETQAGDSLVAIDMGS